MVVVTFITHTQNREGGKPWTKAGTAAYDALSRSVWGLGVGELSLRKFLSLLNIYNFKSMDHSGILHPEGWIYK